MPTQLDRSKVRAHLEAFRLRPLFIEELGWDHGGEDVEVVVGGRTYAMKAIAHKRGMVAYRYLADTADAFPDHPTRQKIDKAVAKSVREHFIIYAPPGADAQYWQWVKHEPGQPDRPRLHKYYSAQTGEGLIQKLEQLVITLDEEGDTTLVDVVGRVRAAFDVERVTRRFYDRFKKEHDNFLGFIEGIERLADREWYASLMLNRMMFIYFIQKRGFLDGDPDYLRNRLAQMQEEQGKGQFLRFYRFFLLRLFHEGLAQPESDRAPDLARLLGRVPYLNGGLFEVHDLEKDNPGIEIPDEAFQAIFDFFDAYQWHLDDRPLRNDSEINPDVLGYIFEKYINQKQMGAYYTKEDITGYISRNTVIPFLFDQAKKECPIAFKPGGGVWRLLQDEPDRYFHDAMRHGITYDIHSKSDLDDKLELPSEISVGINDMSRRDGWNAPASTQYGLRTETWREHVARRQRYEVTYAKLAAGEVTSINDLITYNLDIEKFAQDVIAASEGPELVRAFWKAINKVSVLDPTCGSGAFLFAALNILEPIYIACLESMRGFIDDLERSERKHHPERMNDFRKVLDRVAAHASERYFILKSIVIGNLYGVDIMEEAVEICKLRLFLKLVAQLDSYDQIEPLPDIDFNIRAGNTLVGFASLDEVKRALGADMVKQLALPDIEERAEIADKAFRQFRNMQTEHAMPAGAFSNAKMKLRERLDDLRAELDRYLADDHGINVSEEGAYERWCVSHQPFHWFVEFYGIMRSGGFDVIIGNPPYVAKKKVPYKIVDAFSDIYASVLIRAMDLLNNGRHIGMIIPLSLMFSEDFRGLRQITLQRFRNWFASFDNIPAALFSGVSQRCTIWIGKRDEIGVLVTRMQRWRSAARSNLLCALKYVVLEVDDVSATGIPRIGSYALLNILRAHNSVSGTTDSSLTLVRRKNYPLGFSPAARNFISVYIDPPPVLDAATLLPVENAQSSIIGFDTEAERFAALALGSGDVCFWYWLARCDGFHVTNWLLKDYYMVINSINDEYFQILVKIGMYIHNERMESLVFKKNAGKYVGNFNYQNLRPFTKRADLFLLSSLSISLDNITALFDHVALVRSVNPNAGEKGIPEGLRKQLVQSVDDTVKSKHCFSQSDAVLRRELNCNGEFLDHFLSRT